LTVDAAAGKGDEGHWREREWLNLRRSDFDSRSNGDDGDPWRFLFSVAASRYIRRREGLGNAARGFEFDPACHFQVIEQTRLV
jgi:hypothetical protein